MKYAFVTGSRRGIGLGIAKALAEDGYHVILSGTTTLEATQDVLDSLSAFSVEYRPCDISDLDQIRETVNGIFADYGRLDVLVNNAGVAPKERRDILEMTPESYAFVLDTNLRGTFFMCQTVANHMIRSLQEPKEDYKPRIINICSMSAYTSSTNRGDYCISKAGISMVTTLFADRLAEYGIPVFEVRPGIIKTDMTAKVSDKYQRLIDDGLTPIRRFGLPEDVAGFVRACCSGNLDFTTGQVLDADGGFHLRRL